MKVEIFVKLKQSILDPQGKAVENTLHSLGYENVSNVRISKYIELDIDETDIDVAEEKIHEICDKVLANPNTESYSWKIRDAK